MWILFARNSNNENKHSKVLTYINIKYTRLYFFLRKDIINYKNINLVSFFNNSSMYFLINIYSDNHQSALKCLKDTKVNLNNILIMMGDFNIRDNNWNPFYIICLLRTIWSCFLISSYHYWERIHLREKTSYCQK